MAEKIGVDKESENLTLTEKLGRRQCEKFEELKRKLIEEKERTGKLYEDPKFPADGKLHLNLIQLLVC